MPIKGNEELSEARQMSRYHQASADRLLNTQHQDLNVEKAKAHALLALYWQGEYNRLSKELMG